MLNCRYLQNYGLCIAPESVQRSAPFSYLGTMILQHTVKPQKVQIRFDSLKMLNDFQKLLGDINWLRPQLGITIGQLQPLFDILRGDSVPSSPRELTLAAKQTL